MATHAQIRALEKVQMRAVNMIEGIQHLDYEHKLRELNLTTLSARRARGMMIEMWKHFHIYDKAILTKSFKPAYSARRNMECHRLKAVGIHSKTFYAAAGIAWNQLPLDVRVSTNINTFTFKAHLNRC